jgi:acetoin utilization deacetylase AcuC-like enzyme
MPGLLCVEVKALKRNPLREPGAPPILGALHPSLFPGTGSMTECGEYNNIVNAPLRAGDGGDTFREAFEIAIFPKVQEFRPDLIVISAGFDAHRLDPLANLNFSEADFGWATLKIMEIADIFPKGTHFAAWEQTELFFSEMRASFKSLRS